MKKTITITTCNHCEKEIDELCITGVAEWSSTDYHQDIGWSADVDLHLKCTEAYIKEQKDKKNYDFTLSEMKLIKLLKGQ